MKTVKFSDQELEFMRQMYLDELANAEKYILQIKDILSKLGVPLQPAVEVIPEAEPKKLVIRRGRKKQSKHTEPKEPKKRGRKPKKAVSNIIESLMVAKQTDEKVATVAEPKENKRSRRKPKSVSAEKAAKPTKSLLVATPAEKPVLDKEVKEQPKRKVIQRKGKKGRMSAKPSKLKAKKVPAPESKKELPVISDTVVPANEGIVEASQQ